MKFDVFLSFRGEDTRVKFTSHLHKKLCEKGIETYIDNRLEKGDNISNALVEAIRSSQISVIVFSVNYATSSWCLDEVLCILKCMREKRQVVIPVFYEVDPSHVRKQLGTYDEAFMKLKARFSVDKVKQWRDALTEVAHLAGFPTQQYSTDSELVEAIVKDILGKLNGVSASDRFKGLIGIDHSVTEMEKLLRIDSPDVRIIGIWGMGGLGKTTLARVMFERLSPHFGSRCFLSNVREESRKQGLDELRKTLFSVLLDEKDLNDVTTFHEDRLRRKKVLVVLDDVDQPEQLDDLAEDRSWFGDGSRVIITTRDDQVLRDRADGKYELRGLNSECALQLFNMNAFKRNSPTSDDIVLSKRVVDYAKGIPLALKVLGSFLRSRRRENWEIELDKLKEVPNKTVQNALEISYNGLDEHERRVFLDIVCFVDIGEATCRHYVERMLGGDSSLKREIDSLIDKSLIFDEHNYLRMHDLVIEMGSEIVRQQSVKEPGKRTRLWVAKDCYSVLKNNTGTIAIEGISVAYPTNKDLVDFSPAAFNEMHMLRFLLFGGSNVKPSRQLEYLPHSLKYLEWENWPFKFMPTNFCPRNLVELRMSKSKLERLWSGDQKLGNLKHVDLSYSHDLTDVSALSLAPNLESVDLSYCHSLCEVSSLKFGGSGENSHKCDSLQCNTLGRLKLFFCKNLKVVSSISGCVKEIELGCSLIEEISVSAPIEELRLSYSPRLERSLTTICKLKSLRRLFLNYCLLSEIPQEIGCLSLLEELDLSGNLFREIPPEIQQLIELRKLLVSCCVVLKFLPELPLSVELVDACECAALRAVSSPTDVLQRDPWTDYHATRSRQYLFLACPLDQNTLVRIVEEFQLRVLRTAATIRLNNVKFNNEEFGGPKIAICLSGNKIPKWFWYHSETSTINVKLPSQWHNANFLGFAVSAAVVPKKRDSVDMYLSCSLSFITINNGKIRTFIWDLSDDNLGLCCSGEDNILMLYKYENYDECRDAVQVSLQFYIKPLDNLQVTASGIRLLYIQDYEDKFRNCNCYDNSFE